MPLSLLLNGPALADGSESSSQGQLLAAHMALSPPFLLANDSQDHGCSFLPQVRAF